jgi:DNA-binding XRE family transcriptional regulator
MNNKHTTKTGMRNPNSKLTWTKVKLIRQNKTATYNELAIKFGVSPATIYQVKNEITWLESKRPPKRKYTVSVKEGRKLAGKTSAKPCRRKIATKEAS